MNAHFLAGIFISLFYFTIGLLMMSKAAVPSRIYGYRSPAARKNMDTWVEANHFAGRWIMIVGSILIVLQVFLIIDFPGPERFYPAVIGGMIIGTFYVIRTTESHLKKLFFKDGKRRPNR